MNPIDVIKVFLTVLVCLVLAGSLDGCGLEGRLPSDNYQDRVQRRLNDIIVLEVDSCEYLSTTGYNGYIVIHKGNCKNSIHK